MPYSLQSQEDLGVSKLQHSLVHLNNTHFRLILDEISQSLLSPLCIPADVGHWSKYFRNVIFCVGIFSCTVSVCVMGWWRLIWVMIQLVHHHTPRSPKLLSKHGPAEAYSQRMNKKMSLNVNNREFFNENELFMMILLFIWPLLEQCFC